MRFPWLQVDADFIAARSRDFASLLPHIPVPEAGPNVTRPVSRQEAMGMMLDLWSWVLGRTAQDSPPTGLVTGVNAPRLIAGAVEWRGDPGLLVEALVGSGLAEWDQSVVRLKGLDRYQRTWAKNSRRTTAPDPGTPANESTGRKPAENRQNAAPDRAETGALDADADAEITSASQRPASAGPDRPPLVLKEQTAKKPPRKHREPTQAETLYKDLQESRQERCAEVGETFISDNWDFARQNERLRPLCGLPPEEGERLTRAWGLYLEDADNRAREPPWSLAYFLSPGVRSKYETRAAREAAA